MEGSSTSSFGIDTILSNPRSGSPVMMNGDFRTAHGEARAADFLNRATPSPCSEIDTVGTTPSSPISVTAEHPEQHLAQDGLSPQHHHLHHGQHPEQQQPKSLQPSPQQQQQQQQQLGSCSSAPRTSTSSFLIKDILGDSKPLAACAPYSTSVSSPHPTPKQESNSVNESFRPKLEQDDNRTKLDKRDDTQNELKCHGEWGTAGLRNGCERSGFETVARVPLFTFRTFPVGPLCFLIPLLLLPPLSAITCSESSENFEPTWKVGCEFAKPLRRGSSNLDSI